MAVRGPGAVQRLPGPPLHAAAESAPSRDRSHNPWREADRKAQCGKSARCVRRGGGWRRDHGSRTEARERKRRTSHRTLPCTRQSSTLPEGGGTEANRSFLPLSGRSESLKSDSLVPISFRKLYWKRSVRFGPARCGEPARSLPVPRVAPRLEGRPSETQSRSIETQAGATTLPAPVFDSAVVPRPEDRTRRTDSKSARGRLDRGLSHAPTAVRE